MSPVMGVFHSSPEYIRPCDGSRANMPPCFVCSPLVWEYTRPCSPWVVFCGHLVTMTISYVYMCYYDNILCVHVFVLLWQYHICRYVTMTISYVYMCYYYNILCVHVLLWQYPMCTYVTMTYHMCTCVTMTISYVLPPHSAYKIPGLWEQPAGYLQHDPWKTSGNLY